MFIKNKLNKYIFIQTNSKWIKCLNVRLETINFLAGNVGIMLFDVGLQNIFFFSYIFLGQRNKKINKCDYINLKHICTVKEITRKTKCLPTEWEKIFANSISDKGLYPKCNRNSYNSTSNKTKQTNPIKK